MVRTFTAGLMAPVLLWAVGCSSQTAQNPAEGQPPAASTGGEVAPATHASSTGGESAAASSGGSGAASSGSSPASATKALSPQEQIARGVKLSSQGKRRDAIAAYTAALKQEPKNLSALLCRAAEQYALQEFDAAEKDVEQALSIDSTFAEAYILRAHLWGVRHDYQRAVDDFYAGLKHPERDANFSAYFGDDKDVVAHVYLAAAYAECPDLNFRDDAKAFEHAMQACQLDKWQNRRYVSLLVDAIAGAKTQEEVLQRQEEAINIAPTDTIKDVLKTAVKAFDLRSEFPLR